MIYRFAGLNLDTASRLLSNTQGPIDVPRRVFDCLCYLVANRSRAVGRDELIRHVWGRENVSDTQLAQIVLRARRLVSDDGAEQKMIRTVAGFGYHWIGTIEVAGAESAGQIGSLDDSPGESVDARSGQEREPGSAAPVAEPAAGQSEPRAQPDSNRSHRRMRWLFAILAVPVLLGLGVAMWSRWFVETPAPATDSDSTSPLRALVLPAQVEASDHIDWARLGLMDLIAGRLRESGIAVPPSESVLSLLDSGKTDQAEEIERVRGLAQAGLVVQAKVQRLSSGWRVQLDGKRSSGLGLQVEAQHADLIEAGVRASDALLIALDRRPYSGDSHPSVAQQEIRAALLGNELDLVRRLLSELPDEERDTREARYLSAELDFRAGRHAESRAALDQLLLDPKTDADPVFRGRVLVARGSVSLRLSDYAASDRDFLEACALLEGSATPRDLGRAVMGRGIVAMRLRDDELALSELGRARMLLESAGDDLGVARAGYNFAALDSRRGQILQAIPVMEAAARSFENYGSVNELSKSLSGLVDLQSSLLRWPDALKQSDRAMALLPRLIDPQMQAGVRVSRASVMLGLGRLSEAQRLLSEVGLEQLPSDCGECVRARLVQAQLYWQHGALPSVIAAGDTVLQVAEDGFSQGLRDRALLLKIQAGIRLEDAVETVDGYWPESWAPWLEASHTPAARAAYALWQLRHGQPAEAEQSLREALRQAEARNDFESVLTASQLLVDLLLQADRIDEASALIGRHSGLAEYDYEFALLFLRLQHRSADQRSWARALERTRALAGERSLPPELTRLTAR